MTALFEAAEDCHNGRDATDATPKKLRGEVARGLLVYPGQCQSLTIQGFIMHSKRRALAILAGLLIIATLPSQAAPARFYKWQGDDRIVCAQTSPGPGWTRMNGSYIKADCSI